MGAALSAQADKSLFGQALANRPSPAAPEPLPWELACAQPPYQPRAQPPPAHCHTSSSSTFAMHRQLASLPDPMVLEATLPLPTATIQIPHHLVPNESSQPWQTAAPNAELLLGPDGEPWLPDDPFHSFDGPSAFDPNDEWIEEQPAPFMDSAAHAQSDLLDADAEAINLTPGLLDSPPHRDELSDQPPPSSTLKRLCDVCVVAPPPPLLPNPSNSTYTSAAADQFNNQVSPPATATNAHSATPPPPTPPLPSIAAPDTSFPTTTPSAPRHCYAAFLAHPSSTVGIGEASECVAC
jgi:hypothetical protein